MSRLNVDQLARERAAAEAELLELERATLQARKRLNTLALINNLPVEVLAIIFRFLVVFDPPGQRALGDLGWISASFVCSYWRTVILSTPRLWSTPSFAISAIWANEMLVRAKNAPISVRLGGLQLKTTSWQSALVRDIFQSRMSSIHHISLMLELGHLESLRDVLSQPAPVLQELILSSMAWDMLQGGMAKLNASLFSGSAPRLRQIILNSVFISWDSKLFRNLERLSVKFGDKHLFLGSGDSTILQRLSDTHPPERSESQLERACQLAQDVFISIVSGSEASFMRSNDHLAQRVDEPDESGADSTSPSAPEILSILKHSPDLRALALIRCMPSRRTFPAAGTIPPVVLPRLEEMSIGGHVQDCEAFLNTITTPSLRSLDLSCHFIGDSVDICWPIVSYVQRFLYQPSVNLEQHPVSHLVISMTGRGYGVKVVVQLQGMEDSTLALVFMRQASRVYWDRTLLISRLFSALPALYTATVLGLEANSDDEDGLSFPDWIAFAPYMPCIQVIRLAAMCLERAWRVLHSPDLFPSLRVIVLCFRKGVPIPTDIEAGYKENFMRMRRVRSDAGRPPLAIVFSSGKPVPGL